jgi:hypothetical protein
MKKKLNTSRVCNHHHRRLRLSFDDMAKAQVCVVVTLQSMFFLFVMKWPCASRFHLIQNHFFHSIPYYFIVIMPYDSGSWITRPKWCVYKHIHKLFSAHHTEKWTEKIKRERIFQLYRAIQPSRENTKKSPSSFSNTRSLAIKKIIIKNFLSFFVVVVVVVY